MKRHIPQKIHQVTTGSFIVQIVGISSVHDICIVHGKSLSGALDQESLNLNDPVFDRIGFRIADFFFLTAMIKDFQSS